MIVFLTCGMARQANVARPDSAPSEGAARNGQDAGGRIPKTIDRLRGWTPTMLLLPMTPTMAEMVIEEAANGAAEAEQWGHWSNGVME